MTMLQAAPGVDAGALDPTRGADESSRSVGDLGDLGDIDDIDDVVTIRGRCVVPGVAEADALVTRERISGWGGVDPRTGTVVETRHELRGQRFAGRVFVLPGAKGSSGWSAQFHVARLMGTAPAAWLFNEMTTKMALGAVVSHAPSMTDFDRDPLAIIRTGDRVRVDATAGVVTIVRRAAR